MAAAQKEAVKLKLSIGSVALDYEGNQLFLQSNVPQLMEAMDRLHLMRLNGVAEALQASIDASRGVHAELAEAMAGIKSDLDSMSEMGETESLRLQMAMDRMSKMLSTLSNILKKISDTAQSITQNVK